MRQLWFFVRFFLFWIILFLLQRITFLILTVDAPGPIRIIDLFLVNRYGMIMDVSMASYIMMLAILIWFLTLPFKPKVFSSTIRISSWILIPATSLITITDSALFMTWGSRINAKAFSYLLYPDMIGDAILSVPYLKLLFSWLLLSAVAIVIWYGLMIRNRKPEEWRDRSWISAAVALLLVPIAITGARGGVGKFPLGKGRVFFSDNMTLNHAALNGSWNFTEVLLSLKENTENPYAFYPDEEAKEIYTKRIKPISATAPETIFTIDRPNIVMVMLESFTAENIGSLGGEGNAPNLDRLLDSSFVFTRFFANGYRSEHGLVAVLSGFPPLPHYSIQRESNRIIHLPIFPKILKDSLNYTLHYYNTYDIHYARINEYLALGRFDRIVTDLDFEHAKKHQWGVLDEYLFDFVINDLKNNDRPFFSIVVTSTSHEPFNADVPEKFSGRDEATRYRNTIYYTDSCLDAFLNKAKSQSWYPNTIFIILADHGHAFPKNRPPQDPEKYHIPLIFFGPALKAELRGKRVEIPASQSDIPATLLGQLGLNSGRFLFSRDVMDPSMPHSAWFSHDELFGYINSGGGYTYFLTNGTVHVHNPQNQPDSTDIKEGKVFLQALYNEFMSH